MPTEEEISLNQQSLYDSAALRDDLNDTEATILLNWAEGQVARVAKDFPDEFEQKNRFLRQLIKGINRFVGQREFNELEGQKEYLKKFTMYLPQLGWGHVSEEELLAAIPTDKKDMFGTLRAILALLSPPTEATPAGPIAPTEAASASPMLPAEQNLASRGAAEITNPYNHTLENSNSEGINQDCSETKNEE
jgi:hypothetical protein